MSTDITWPSGSSFLFLIYFCHRYPPSQQENYNNGGVQFHKPSPDLSSFGAKLNNMNNQTTERERRDATEDEIKTLPHVVDSIPLVVWIALVAGALERFTYYAVTAPWRKCLSQWGNNES